VKSCNQITRFDVPQSEFKYNYGHVVGKIISPKLQTVDIVNAMNYHKSGLYNEWYIWHRKTLIPSRQESGSNICAFGLASVRNGGMEGIFHLEEGKAAGA
jgi:hypothetical protein